MSVHAVVVAEEQVKRRSELRKLLQNDLNAAVNAGGARTSLLSEVSRCSLVHSKIILAIIYEGDVSP